MILPLRRRHRAMVCTLAVVLPAAFAAGILGRPSVPVVQSVPASLDGKGTDFGSVVWSKTDLWPEQQIITSLWRNAGDRVALELTADLLKPDVLVYWALGKASASEDLPGNVRLLGALVNGKPLPIPRDAWGEAGRLVLYSLAEHEIVARSKEFVLQKEQ